MTIMKRVELLLDHNAQVDIVDNKKKTALMHASEGFHEDTVVAILAKRPSIDATDDQGNTAVMLAIQAGRSTKIVEALLAHGAKLDIQQGFMLAAASGDADMIQFLFDRGAQINERDAEGKTALIRAINFDRMRNYNTYSTLDDIAVLLKLGAQVNIPDSEGKTPLMHAFLECYFATEIADLLLAHKADTTITQQDNAGTTALMLASKKAPQEMVERLLKHGAQVNVQDNKGGSALTWAVSGYDRASVVRTLLAADSNQNISAALPIALAKGYKDVVDVLMTHGGTIDQASALKDAASKGNMEIVEWLLEHGAPVDTPDEKGRTPLMVAASSFLFNTHGTDIVAALIRHGAQVDKKDLEGKTALVHALTTTHSIRNLEERAESVRRIEILLKSAAGPDRTDTFMLAAKNDAHEVVDILITHGEPLTSTDKEGKTALMHAVIGGNIRVAQTLLLNPRAQDLITMRDAQGMTALMHVVKTAPLYMQEIIELLLKHGAQIAQQDKKGKTALMHAVNSDHHGHKKIVAALLAHNPQDTINKQDKQGLTALMHATARDDLYALKTVKSLLKHGAQVAIKDAQGNTALIHATSRGRSDTLELLSKHTTKDDIQNALTCAAIAGRHYATFVLIEHGAQVDTPDSKGITPLTHAVASGKEDVVELLISKSSQEKRYSGPIEWQRKRGLAKKFISCSLNMVKSLMCTTRLRKMMSVLVNARKRQLS